MTQKRADEIIRKVFYANFGIFPLENTENRDFHSFLKEICHFSAEAAVVFAIFCHLNGFFRPQPARIPLAQRRLMCYNV